MKTKAAVVREAGKLTIETVALDAPKAGEVLVRIRAAGVCHSDLHNLRGELRATPPMVLGHEGAGVVEAVGDGVTKVEPGDHILINWLPACGECQRCLRGTPNLCERLTDTTFRGMLPDGTSRLRTLDGIRLKHLLGVATMAEAAVIGEANAIPIPKDVPFEVAAIIGCAVVTGIGAVTNTGRARAGDSAAVIGCGGVGLSAVIGCRLAGCHPIIAVDVLEGKLDLARRMGATHTVNARRNDVVESLGNLIHDGPDFVFDTVGSAETVPLALRAIRPAGTAVLVGLHSGLGDVAVPVSHLVMQNKRMLGAFVGSMRPLIDLPKLVELYRAGRLPLDDLISKRYPLDALPQAFDDMEAGEVARGAIVFD